MGKISNTFIIFITVCCLGFFIAYKTFENANNEHNENLIYAMKSKVEYKANRCYLEKKCKGEVSLKHLYDKGYLDTVVNPVTKEVVDENTVISYKDEKAIVYWE